MDKENGNNAVGHRAAMIWNQTKVVDKSKGGNAIGHRAAIGILKKSVLRKTMVDLEDPLGSY